MGSRAYALTGSLPLLRHQLTDPLVQATRFQTVLQHFVPKDALALTLRCVYASKNHESFIRNFTEEKALKDY